MNVSGKKKVGRYQHSMNAYLLLAVFLQIIAGTSFGIACGYLVSIFLGVEM